VELRFFNSLLTPSTIGLGVDINGGWPEWIGFGTILYNNYMYACTHTYIELSTNLRKLYPTRLPLTGPKNK